MKKIIIGSLLGIFAIAPFINAQDEKSNVPAETMPVGDVPAKITVATRAQTTPAGWTDNFEAAKKQAAIEGKLLLVDFSGSDWCVWCQRLHDEIFSKKEFNVPAEKKYVCVFIDMPQKAKLPAEVEAQNKDLLMRFRVSGFPTVLVLDAEGNELARTGYQKTEPEKYLEHLETITKTARIVKALEAEIKSLPQGEARAKKIDAVLSKLSFSAQRNYAKLIEEILETDADGKLGLRTKYPFFALVEPLQKEFQAIALEIDTETRAALSTATDEQKRAREFVMGKIGTILKTKTERLNALEKKVEAAKEKLQGEESELLQNFITALQNMKRMAK